MATRQPQQFARPFSVILFGAALVLVGGPPAYAQFAPPSPFPAPAAPTYGYQPYDTANPKGFYHPNDMGYGSYINPTKLKGHRAPALSYRRFRGY